MSGEERAARYRRRAHRIPGIWLPVVFVDPLRRCEHLHQRGIYGDEIIAAGWKRSRCLDCGRLLRDLPTPEQNVDRRLPAPQINPKFHAGPGGADPKETRP